MALDRRIQRTRRLLEQAVLELARERDLDAIAVSDITERAGVSRVTFYDHYAGRDELLIAAMEQAFVEIAQATAGLYSAGGPVPEEPPRALVDLLSHIAEHAAVYRTMLGARGSALFADAMRQRMTASLAASRREEFATAPPGGVDEEVYLDFAVGALLGVITGRLRADAPFVPEETARMLWALLVP